jgi:hypothetical protein
MKCFFSPIAFIWLAGCSGWLVDGCCKLRLTKVNILNGESLKTNTKRTISTQIKRLSNFSSGGNRRLKVAFQDTRLTFVPASSVLFTCTTVMALHHFSKLYDRC